MSIILQICLSFNLGIFNPFIFSFNCSISFSFNLENWLKYSKVFVALGVNSLSLFLTSRSLSLNSGIDNDFSDKISTCGIFSPLNLLFNLKFFSYGQDVLLMFYIFHHL